jgi:hypothetical protein
VGDPGGVATDLLGKSGRAMLDALVSGTTDPTVLADLARGVLRKKIPALREALRGRFDAEHALIVGRSSPTSTSSSTALRGCRPPSKNGSPRLQRRSNRCARYPGSSAAPPRSSSPKPAAT